MVNGTGKKSSPLYDIGLSEWTAELTSELLRLLWILEKTLSLYPEQAAILSEILHSELLFDGDLGAVADACRKPPKFSDEQVELEL